MHALHEAMQLILQYLEEIGEAKGAARGALLQDPLILGGVRVVGRFMAEAPDALADKVVELLPLLLEVSDDARLPAW